MTHSLTYFVGVIMTVGASLSLSNFAGLNLFASVSQTTTKSTSQGASAPSPEGPWKCALAIYPEFLQIPSRNTDWYSNSKLPPSKPYTVSYLASYKAGEGGQKLLWL